MTPPDNNADEEIFDAKPERKLLAAGQDLSAALWRYYEAVQSYHSDPASTLSLDEFMGHFSKNLIVNIDHSLVGWRRAIALVEANARVATRNPRGLEWKDPLHPGALMYYARVAAPEDLGYRDRLRIVNAKEHARLDQVEQELSHVCGHPTHSRKPCRKLPTFWPGSGRKSACSIHLTANELAEVSALWDRIVDEFTCPGCAAKAGEECSDDTMVLVDGFYPTPKALKGRSVHTPRLQLLGDTAQRNDAHEPVTGRDDSAVDIKREQHENSEDEFQAFLVEFEESLTSAIEGYDITLPMREGFLCRWDMRVRLIRIAPQALGASSLDEFFVVTLGVGASPSYVRRCDFVPEVLTIFYELLAGDLNRVPVSTEPRLLISDDGQKYRERQWGPAATMAPIPGFDLHAMP
ncbi:hypothetical protein [Arthrobacter sp. efr-133-TYG-120]|uniref:hypothetical protein n=1 Tax=Arthrobacter sp. efr-133-TYG-120 TaxID=3040280 RepID=UPI00254FEEF7|nr:hypothetical protein [Arthrobacter sp. efr-133-TYG-120]